jgi:hypothetical protein
MVIQFTRLGQIVAIIAISSLITVEAIAQPQPTEAQPQPIAMMRESILDAFQGAFFSHTGNAFENQTILSPLNSIFGFNFYPEKQIARDGELIHAIYKDVMQQQTASTPSVKTRDLTNPFTTSLYENPDYIRVVPFTNGNFYLNP